MAILKLTTDLEVVKKDDSVTPLEQLVKRNQSLQQLVKRNKIPTPLQLLVKEMPGQTLLHSYFSLSCIEGCFMACLKSRNMHCIYIQATENNLTEENDLNRIR